MILFIALFWYQ